MSTIGARNKGSTALGDVVIPAIPNAVIRITPAAGCSAKVQISTDSNAVNLPTSASWQDWPHGVVGGNTYAYQLSASATAIKIIQLTGAGQTYYEQALANTQRSSQTPTFTSGTAPSAVAWPVNLPVIIDGVLKVSNGTSFVTI